MLPMNLPHVQPVNYCKVEEAEVCLDSFPKEEQHLSQHCRGGGELKLRLCGLILSLEPVVQTTKSELKSQDLHNFKRKSRAQKVREK